jgi:cobalt-zinc-cadmium efflux system protein
MRAVPGVSSVHDFHLWALTSGKASLTAHVVYDAAYSPEQQLLPALKDILATRFGVYHTTLQFEMTPCAHTDDGCNYGLPAERHAASHAHDG